MRPPQNAGEDLEGVAVMRLTAHGFNEAPAERGGRLRRAADAGRAVAASMRPPQNAGEDSGRLPPAATLSRWLQ